MKCETERERTGQKERRLEKARGLQKDLKPDKRKHFLWKGVVWLSSNAKYCPDSKTLGDFFNVVYFEHNEPYSKKTVKSRSDDLASVFTGPHPNLFHYDLKSQTDPRSAQLIVRNAFGSMNGLAYSQAVLYNVLYNGNPHHSNKQGGTMPTLHQALPNPTGFSHWQNWQETSHRFIQDAVALQKPVDKAALQYLGGKATQNVELSPGKAPNGQPAGQPNSCPRFCFLIQFGTDVTKGCFWNEKSVAKRLQYLWRIC